MVETSLYLFFPFHFCPKYVFLRKGEVGRESDGWKRKEEEGEEYLNWGKNILRC